MSIKSANHLPPLLQQFIRQASPEVLHAKLNTMAAGMGEKDFAMNIAQQVISLTQPHLAVPDVYRHYRPVVRDGIAFFLSQLTRQRLVELVVSQLKLAPQTSIQERLLEMAKRFPTLHKLGQIIARNPHIDPKIKNWLIHLENGQYGTPVDDVLTQVDHQLKQTGASDAVKPQPFILSEASVGTVLPFQRRSTADGRKIQGVFKVLKPHIRDYLEEELDILEKTAIFFENNRKRYSLRDFKFLNIFQDVRQMLIKEIDLAAEQVYLVEAARNYQDMPHIQIPKVFSLSTDTMTAMAYLDGTKITDADLKPEECRYLAGALFEALICRPLFSRKDKSLFHGDPHAGNILALNASKTNQVRIGLLDWSLAGHLSKNDRLKTTQLIQALLKNDLNGICNAAAGLTGDTMTPMQRHKCRDLVLRLLKSAEFTGMNLIPRAFNLLEQLTFEGFVFSADLMLFRKAIFTLEGVLCDLWPSFDMDAALQQYLSTLMTQELPLRFNNLFFPMADTPENYTSMITNRDIQSILLHQYAAVIKSTTRSFFDNLAAWGWLFSMPFWPVLAQIGLSQDLTSSPP